MTKKTLILIGISLCFALLLGKLFLLQIVDKQYKITASNNAIRYETIYPSRGLIYDRHGTPLVDNRTTYDILITPKELSDFDTTLFCSIFNLKRDYFDQLLDRIKERRAKIGYQSVVFLRQVTYEQYAQFVEKAYLFPGFLGQGRNVRNYPVEVCGNLLGYINEAGADFLEKNPEYKTGDYVGCMGLEEFYEPYLRGEKGYSLYLRDVHNRVKSRYEDGAYDKKAVPGNDLITTIDLPLQQFGEQLMKNKVGAIVALEPQTGEVLSMITSEGLSVEQLSQIGKYYAEATSNPLKPLFNRAIMSAYPPGSVYKMVTGLIGYQEGVVTPGTMYSCHNGYPVGRGVGCHVHPSPINLVQSIAMSCNAYYCYVFRDIIDNPKYPSISNALLAWRSYSEGFGFGSQLGIDLPGERSGTLPTPEVYNRYHGKNRWKSLSIISLAIGQGEIGATPLQLANLAAIMANRGHYYTPHIVREITGDSLFTPTVERHEVPIDPAKFTPFIEGMYMAVNGGLGSGGTATWTALPSLELCGKTGTAQNPQGDENAVFICFAPRENPKIALAVYVEQGKSGSGAAAPIASLLVEKYLHGSISPGRQWLLEYVLHQNYLHKFTKK